MIKIGLYVLIMPIVIWSFDSININNIFKKNRVYQARVFYIICILYFINLFFIFSDNFGIFFEIVFLILVLFLLHFFQSKMVFLIFPTE